jgi:hypothetical protein
MSEEIRVLHVISGLEVGGAETMLCRLIEHSDDNIRHHVVPLRGRGPLATRVESHAELTPLNLKSWRLPAGVIQLARVIKRARPHVVQGWL